MKSKDALYRNSFSHVYVEKELADDPAVSSIISHIGDPVVIIINHCKDVFNKPSQNPAAQKLSPKLILAGSRDSAVHTGAPYCNDFGYERFFYVSNILNCPFDCSYCYLKGKFPSSNILAFLNTDEIFSEVIEKTGGNPSLLTLSYDSDELAMEPVLGLLSRWKDFIGMHEWIDFELRTKSTVIPPFPPYPNLTIGISMLPQEIIMLYEPKTPALSARIKYANNLIDAGYNLRICIDPVLETEDYLRIYTGFISEINEALDLSRIRDISLGSFRMPSDYFKRMSSGYGNHFLHFHPFETRDGQVRYPKTLEKSLIDAVLLPLRELIGENRIYMR